MHQWRHLVFCRARDVAHIHPLTATDIGLPGARPEQDGLQLNYRLVPVSFAWADAPVEPTILARP